VCAYTRNGVHTQWIFGFAFVVSPAANVVQTLIQQNRDRRKNLTVGEDGSRGIRWEHFACSSADEQCDHHRRESPQRLPQRHHARAPPIRCAIQARPRNADQHQEHRQPRRPRRRPQQAPDHPAGRLQRALQNPRSRETLVHSEKRKTQRRHVRRFARFVSLCPIALWFAFCVI